MANILVVKWKEKNPEFMESIIKLRELYSHDGTVLEFGDMKPTVAPSVVGKAGGLADKTLAAVGRQTKEKKTTQQINAQKEGIELTVTVPMQEDFQVNLQSSFKSIEDMLPGSVGNIVSTAKNLFRAIGGTNDFTSMFGFQVWEETKPIELNLELTFHTVKNGWLDVWVPVMSLAAQSILSVDYKKGSGEFAPSSSYRTPGVNLGNLKFMTKAASRQNKAGKNAPDPNNVKALDVDTDKGTKEQQDAAKAKVDASEESKNFAKNAKTVSVNIPGILFIGTGMITSAKPTFSKELTESGAPLWGKVDFTVMSIMPAYDRMIFQSGMTLIKDLKKKGIKDKLEGFVRNAF